MITAVVATPSYPVLDNVITDSSTTIRTSVGQLFVIALDANRTTGYSWSVADPGSLVSCIGSAYLATSPGRLGSGGQQLLIFRAASEGSGTLELRYVRPFDASPDDNAKRVTFRFTVNARGPNVPPAPP